MSVLNRFRVNLQGWGALSFFGWSWLSSWPKGSFGVLRTLSIWVLGRLRIRATILRYVITGIWTVHWLFFCLFAVQDIGRSPALSRYLMKMHERVHHRCGNRIYMRLVLMNILRDVDRITMHLFSLWNSSTLNNIIVILLLLVQILSLGNYEGSFLNRLLMVWWNRADYTNFVVVYAWAVIVQEWSRRINSPWGAAILGQLNWYYLVLHIAFLFFDTAEPIGCRTSEMSVRDVQVWLVALSRVVMISSHVLHHLVVALLAHVPAMSWLISMWASEVWWIHVHIVEVLIHIVTWNHSHMWISWVLLLLLLVFLNLFSFLIFALLLLIQILLTTFGSLFANELVRLSLGHHLGNLDGILRRLFWWFCFL